MNNHDACQKMAEDIINMLKDYAAQGINAEYLGCKMAISEVTNYLLNNFHKLQQGIEYGNKSKPLKGWGA